MPNMTEDAAGLIHAAMRNRGEFTVKQAADRTKTWSVTSSACSLLVEQRKARRIRRGVYVILDQRSKPVAETDAAFAARVAGFVYERLGEKDALRLLGLVEQHVAPGEESMLEFALAEEISRHS